MNTDQVRFFWIAVAAIVILAGLFPHKAKAFEVNNDADAMGTDSIRPREQSLKREPVVPVDRRVLKSGQHNHDEAVLIALNREEKKIGALAAINPAGIKPRKTIIIPVDPNVEPTQHETMEYSDPFAEKIDYSKMPSGLAVGVDRKLRLKNNKEEVVETKEFQ